MEQRCKVCHNDKDNEIVYIDERQIGGVKKSLHIYYAISAEPCSVTKWWRI